MNALSSEGVKQGKSGRRGLIGGLLSALMCIMAVLASNMEYERLKLFWVLMKRKKKTVITGSDPFTN